MGFAYGDRGVDRVDSALSSERVGDREDRADTRRFKCDGGRDVGVVAVTVTKMTVIGVSGSWW